jgi:hypothetical protein
LDSHFDDIIGYEHHIHKPGRYVSHTDSSKISKLQYINRLVAEGHRCYLIDDSIDNFGIDKDRRFAGIHVIDNNGLKIDTMRKFNTILNSLGKNDIHVETREVGVEAEAEVGVEAGVEAEAEAETEAGTSAQVSAEVSTETNLKTQIIQILERSIDNNSKAEEILKLML